MGDWSDNIGRANIFGTTEMAGRWIKRRGVRKLPSGAYLVTNDEADEAEIWLEKRAMPKKTGDELEDYLRDLEPDLPYGVALQKHAGDPVVQELYEQQRYDEPEAPPVTKATQWEPPAWHALQKVAARLRAEEPHLTEAGSIEKAYRLRPDLAQAYREQTME